MPRTLYPRALGGRKPTFSLDFSRTNGVDRLDPQLTINSITVSPTFRYKGGDATASSFPAWTFGSALTLGGTGSVPSLNQGSPLLGTNDDSFTGIVSGKAFEGTVNTYNLGTSDFVLEIVFEHTTTGYSLVGKVATGEAYWEVFVAASGLRLTIQDAGAAHTANITSAALTEGSWNHAMVFVDRSGSAQWYVNGAASGSATAVSTVNSISNTTNKFILGGRDGSAGQTYVKRIAYQALWVGNNWLDTHLQANVAMERFSALCGVYPQIAKGTARPSILTRTSIAGLRKTVSGVTTLYKMGANWPRIESLAAITGYLSEPASTNLCLQSETFGTTWTVIQIGDTVSANQATSPDRATTADGLVAVAIIDDQHGVSQDVTVTAVVHTFSVFAKQGDQPFLFMEDTTVANATAYFDLANGVVGTKGAGATASFIESYGNGWYRCGFSFTGTAAAHTFRISPAPSDGDKTFIGDSSTINTYVWGAQVEAHEYMTSPIVTTTAAVTRTLDALSFSSTNNVLASQGSLVGTGLIPNYDNAHVNALLDVNDGTASNRHLLSFYSVSDGIATATVVGGATTANVTGTTNTSTGVKMTGAYSYMENDFKAFLDGVSQGTPDTSGAVPASVSAINVGYASHQTAYNFGPGIIESVKIYKKTNRIS